MKIALVHDYLKEAGGAERVLRVLSEMYSTAPIYTAFVVRNSRAGKMFASRKIVESKWGWFLKIPRFHSYFRFLLPWIWKSIDLSEYDLIITSCSGYIARGFRVGPEARVVAYCHTPPKWLYGYETPTKAQKRWWGRLYLSLFGPFMRYFDYHSAQRVDTWIANSQEVKRRIEKFYRKEATVVYPPIEISKSASQQISKSARDYYLVVGRLVGAKGVELAVEACKNMKRRLVVVGEGKMNSEQRIVNNEEEVKYTGWVSEEKLAELYRGARGYLALAVDEDFGMTVVEAISCGTPVVALASGGYKETVTNETGVLVGEMGVEGVVKGMRELEEKKWNKKKMREFAKKFSRERFEREVRRVMS